MEAEILIRTSSFHHHTVAIISPRSPSGDAGGCFLRRSRSIKLSPRSPRSVLQIEASERREKQSPLRRARSDTDLLGSLPPQRTWSPPAKVAEEEEETEIVLGVGDLWRSIPSSEEVEFSGGGIGKGRKIGGGGGDQHESQKIGEYYEEMLIADPANPLLLRNYGRFLHEVEGDVKRAEVCYGRAILARPGDGEVLSLYGKLVWEAHGDGERAGGYFERAVQASPDDCYVLGSYAQFLWDAEEEEGEKMGAAQPPMVVAF